MFDYNQTGKVALSELVARIILMRGELQKCDMIASWMTLESIVKKLDAQPALIEEQVRSSIKSCLPKGGGVKF